MVWEWKGKGREMRRAEPGSSQKLESRIPGNSYVRFGGERSEKGWPRYHQKELLAGRSNKQYLAGPLPYFLQVTALFFRSLFAFFIIDMRSRKVLHVGVHTSPRSPTDAWTARTAARGNLLWGEETALCPACLCEVFQSSQAAGSASHNSAPNNMVSQFLWITMLAKSSPFESRGILHRDYSRCA